MTNNNRFEILPGLPSYGPMHVPISADGEAFYSEGFVVRFFRSDDSSWIANFQSGLTGLRRVISFSASSKLLVIADGTGYLLEPEQKESVACVGWSFHDAIPAGNDRYVLYDNVALTIVEPDASFWTSERISLDGLAEISIFDNVVTGLSYNPTHEDDAWLPFAYDIDRRTSSGPGVFR